MHEYSVVQSFIELCSDYVASNNTTRVVGAKVKVGILSGIELSLFQRALETFKVGSVLENASIEYIVQPILVECRACESKSTTQKHQVLCPVCGSGDTKVIDGEEMLLMSLEME